MARKFLYFIAICIVLVIAGLFVLRVYSEEITQFALTPSAEFVEQDPLASNAYQDPEMWFSRPGMGAPNDPSRWQPLPRAPEDAAPEAAAVPQPRETPDIERPRFAVFFVHPTSFFDGGKWNAPLDDAASRDQARIFVRGMASPFNLASEIWVPRYRQATFGAFLTDAPEAQRALDAAYADIDQAFTFFIDSVDADMPIVLAGHSQGALHVMRLLEQRVAGTPLADRIAMAYPVGWPISVEHDLPRMALPACATPQQGGCVASWNSFAEPAEPEALLAAYGRDAGLDGADRTGSTILCVNPIDGTLNSTAPASANLGTLVPNETMSDGDLVEAAVPARCDERGLLLIGDPPQMGPGVLPGNNYHVYDIPLFWRNLQEDVVRRVAAWQAQRS